MINEKKMMKSCSVFHTEQMMEFEKFNCFSIEFLRSSFGRIKVMPTVIKRENTFFSIEFLRSSFGRIKVMPTVIKRENTLDITRHICFAYQLTGLYDKRFY